ncbi:hypothetical protein MJO29_015949 [Puccinia striiformis f. sp. tritici]|nr:hypothetical protein MJO29_015949 [Puccinia striiformis f. sp. tritici]
MRACYTESKITGFENKVYHFAARIRQRTTPTQTQASTWRASTSGSKEPKMTVTRMIYNSIMKRNSTYVSTIFAGSFIFSIGFDTITSRWWEQHNKQKLWSTVRDNVSITPYSLDLLSSLIWTRRMTLTSPTLAS